MKKRTTHGVTAYANGECRCRRCRAAWAEYMRQRRESTRPPKPVPYYPDKQPAARRVRLTALGERILQSVVSREAKTADDVLEALLRGCGTHVQFDSEAAAT